MARTEAARVSTPSSRWSHWGTSIRAPLASTSVCNLNSDLNRLCQTLKNAQQKVFDGNCIFTGYCNPQVFVYTPSIYFVTNEDFVRGAVSNFYEVYNRKDTTSFVTLSNKDKVCPSEDEEIDLKRRNAGVLRYCTSTQLERIKDALRIARRIIHLIVEAQYILINLVFSLMRLLTPSQSMVDQVLKEIEFWFLRLWTMINDSIEEIGN